MYFLGVDINNSKPQVIGKLDNHPFITCAAHQGASINALEGKKRPNEKNDKKMEVTN